MQGPVPLGTGLLGHRPAQPEQRANQPPGPDGHPGEGPRAGAAGQAEQHVLRLVVQGVAEPDGGLPDGGLALQSRVAGGAGGGLGTAVGAVVHGHRRDHDIGEPQVTELVTDPVRDRRRLRLQAVVDDDRGQVAAVPTGGAMRAEGQGEGVGPAIAATRR